MIYPMIRASGSRTVQIPEFSAGVNYRDNVSLVNDNQLTDVLNMWYKDGMLRTRPGLTCNTDDISKSTLLETEYVSTSTHKEEISEPVMGVRRTNVTRMNNGTIETLINRWGKFSYTPNGAQNAINKATLSFAFVDINGNATELPALSYTSENEIYPEAAIFFYHYGNLYSCADGVMYMLSGDTWTMPALYAPTIFINGTTQGADGYNYAIKGDMVEGYNLLTNNYKCLFHANSVDNNARYVIPTAFSSNMFRQQEGEMLVEVKHTAANGTVYTHTLTTALTPEAWSGGTIVIEEFPQGTVPSDNKYLCAKVYLGSDATAYNGWIGFVDSNKQLVAITGEEGLKNNLEVTVYIKSLRGDFEPNGICEWFGGQASGIDNGTRLFAVLDNNKLVYSDLNNPLYFPENNYVYVGENNKKITALAKQANMLVIFKENELYYTTYVQNDTPTAEAVQNQAVIDLATNSVVFPIIPIHSQIGCDLPDTICLCQNRLIWACRSGNVYFLGANNQWSESNIVNVSDMISPKLKLMTSGDYNNACAGDYDNKYFLCIGQKVFVLDYGNNALSYVYSYNSNEQAQKRLNWYVWELPEAPLIMFTTLESLAIVCANPLYKIKVSGGKRFGYTHSNLIYVLSGSVSDDVIIRYSQNGTPIPTHIKIHSMFKTKLFNFGRPEKLKKVSPVHIGFGGGNDTVKISFTTDRGERTDEKTVKRVSPDGDRIKTFRLLPQIPHITHFGINVECDGVITVGGVAIYYKQLGSVR